MNYTQTKLYGISNKKYLSELLGIELKKLKEIEKNFTASSFEKERNGKRRSLYNPNHKYKLVLRKLNTLLTQISPPQFILGGIKKRSYAMNAAVHQNNQYFLLMDIENFFPSTNDSYVYAFFRYRLAMSEDIAKICMLLTTVPSKENPNQRFLPQGFPTSPVLSYLCYYEMYSRIYNLAFSKNITFSCYYDDLAFSSINFIHKSLMRQIANIVKEYGLSINFRKTRLLNNRNGVKITGSIVRNNGLVAPNRLQKKMIDNFKELNKQYEDNPNNTEQILNLCNTVQGDISAIKTVEKERELSFISSKVRKIRSDIKKKG